MLYCGVCKLFSPTSTEMLITGFNIWKNAASRLLSHENSHLHSRSFQSWCTRSKKQGLNFCKLYESQCDYWKKVLQRIIDVILFLCKRGLALRGHNEIIGPVNNGNYLGTLELLAKCDAFLASHIEKFGNCGRGNVSYLSSTICDEFIQLVGKYITEMISKEVKKSKYFGIIVDSTPDVQYLDQLTFIIRHVNPATFEIFEHFLKFIPIKSHKGSSLAETVLDYLSECKLDINDCRSQSYDNAANMSSKYNGLQMKIKQINSFSKYALCSAHSLNLVGHTAASICSEAVSFFGIVEKLYSFFANSSYRWSLMNKEITNSKNDHELVPVR